MTWAFNLAPSPRRPRWVRFCAVVGPAPGSGAMGKKVGAWRVHLGPLHGVNVRFFHSFERPCLTLLLHWRFR